MEQNYKVNLEVLKQISVKPCNNGSQVTNKFYVNGESLFVPILRELDPRGYIRSHYFIVTHLIIVYDVMFDDFLPSKMVVSDIQK